MGLRRLDHVNLRTARLQPMVDFYVGALGMDPGPRPPFPFGGAWLYCRGHPCVHLVEVAQQPRGTEPGLEHFAFEAEGLAGFLERVKARGIGYRIVVIPGTGSIQVNMNDPDGNHLHVDFGPQERDALPQDAVSEAP